MKTVLKFSLLISSLFFLNGCEDVVQIKLDEGSKLYVIDAFVNSLPGKQTIRIVTNDSYFSNREAPPVTNASVMLKDLTTGKQFVFNYSANGNYDYIALQDSMSIVGHQYELNVTIDGFNYTSLIVQKRTALIDSISPSYEDGSNGGFGAPQPPFYRCELFAKDKVDNNADYYWIKTLRNDTLFSGSSDINLCIDGTNGAIKDIGVDTIDFTPPVTFLGFKKYKSGDKCRVEIHSISYDTYFFFVQAQTQINNGGLFATTPENVKTNIITPQGAKTRAVGWFNMATVATKTKLIP